MTNRKTTGVKGNKKKSKRKNSSDDTLKFLLVLVIVGLIAAIILLMQENGTEPKGDATPTPTVTTAPSEGPKPTDASKPSLTPEPTKEADLTDTPKPTDVPKPSPTPGTTDTPEATLTPEPNLVSSAADAEKLVRQTISGDYTIQLLNENLLIGNWEYYQFCALNAKKEILYPFLVVNKQDGMLYCYDSAEEVVFDFTEFPLKNTAEPTPELIKDLTVEEAYQVLCGYSKKSLNIAKEVAEYDAEYDSELTFINGINCYRFNLSEVTSDGKVRNRGEFYISTDGTECYYIDSETNEFVLAVK